MEPPRRLWGVEGGVHLRGSLRLMHAGFGGRDVEEPNSGLPHTLPKTGEGHNAADATAHICAAFKGGVMSRWTANRLFQSFKSGDISLEDRPRSGRSTDCNDEALRDALREKPSATTRELSMALGCGRTTIIRHLQALGYRKLMPPTWVPHELSASQLAARGDDKIIGQNMGTIGQKFYRTFSMELRRMISFNVVDSIAHDLSVPNPPSIPRVTVTNGKTGEEREVPAQN
ncbi:hypothetical protein ANCCEY_06509 [Ancylostoma ceylanicum]|uniref:Mos1 transposase HTH domain-containing protein n=1 Tax=Ancylostoma ceylanicum TaxID=53326 RepID=A0A0D6LT80_9BILA|nr:hypothetical protein ANCCEY_06509 [Ancylostoma ceylanicum]